MLQLRSSLTVADNTGAKSVYMIGLPGRGNRRIAKCGDVITAVVKNADPYGQVKRGEKVSAVIVRVRKEHGRRDGSYIRFDDNACVILESAASQNPRGTRVFGPIAREIKEAGFSKIASLAKEIF